MTLAKLILANWQTFLVRILERKYFPIWKKSLCIQWSRLHLSASKCIFAIRPSSSNSNSFSMLFIHSTFLLCSLRSHILLQNCFVSLSFGCWYNFSHFLLAGRIFFDVLECPVLSVMFYYVSMSFCLPSFTTTFPRIVLFVILGDCFFLFVPTYSNVFLLFYRFCLL